MGAPPSMAAEVASDGLPTVAAVLARLRRSDTSTLLRFLVTVLSAVAVALAAARLDRALAAGVRRERRLYEDMVHRVPALADVCMYNPVSGVVEMTLRAPAADDGGAVTNAGDVADSSGSAAKGSDSRKTKLMPKQDDHAGIIARQSERAKHHFTSTAAPSGADFRTFPPLPAVGRLPRVFRRRIRQSHRARLLDDDGTRWRPTDPPKPSARPGINGCPELRGETPDDPNYNWGPDASQKLIAVVSLNAQPKHMQAGHTANNQWMHVMSYHNKKEYCKRWGYDLIIEDRSIVDESRDTAWSKIPIFKKWLPRYQYVFWMDMDALFMRFDLPLEKLLPCDKDLIISKDWHGINMGVFFLRNSPYTYTLLTEMWNSPRSWWEPWEEQSALMKILEPKHNGQKAQRHLRHTQFLEQRKMNSYPDEFSYGNKLSQYQTGDFIAHFPNCKGHPSCRSTIEKYYQAMISSAKLKPAPPTANVPVSVFPKQDDDD